MKTFCIVIGKPMVVARCPLPQGACTWQHRQTNFCKYTDKDISAEDHARLIGAATSKPSEVQDIEQRLIETIRSQV